MTNPVDTLLTQIGNGKWNWLHFLSASLTSGVLAPFALAGAFVVPRLEHRCRQSPLQDAVVDLTYRIDNSSLCSYNVRGEDGGVEVKSCTDWEYESSIFTKTITSDFDLVCDRGHIRALYMSLYMVGVLVSSPITGNVSDRFGRTKTFVTGVILFAILSLISGWLPNIPSLLICRFLIGMTHVPVVKIPFVIGMETCTPKLRSVASIVLYLPWSLYTIAFGGLAYLERDWRWLLTYSSFICLPLLPVLWFLDETPHWLVVRGRYEDALRVLKRAAVWNKASLPSDEDILHLLEEHRTEVSSRQISEERWNKKRRSWFSTTKEKVLDVFILFRTPKLRLISFVIHLGFFAVGFVYYGLAFSGGNLNTDLFTFVALCGVTEIPGATMMPFVVDRIGRKKPYIMGMVVTGVLLSGVAVVPEDHQWLTVTLSLLGRTTICMASPAMYLYGSELFPTEVRTRGVTSAFMMSKTGSAIAPFVTEYLSYPYKWVPTVAFGSITIIAGLSSLVLRETLGTSLPDTIEFLENHDPGAKRNVSVQNSIYN